MISYRLNIAGYGILFQSVKESYKLKPSPSQQSFLSEEEPYDIVINIFRGPTNIFPGSEKVFSAPYVEEINGDRVKKSNKFWTVYKRSDYILVHTTLPLSENINEALLIIRPGEKGWDLIIDSTSITINPLEYPIDGLLLYYLTALKGDIFIHGSGVEYNGKGYLFVGSSGKGKTTMAGLFNRAGAKVIHDDRLIIRKVRDDYLMYNTPVYDNEKTGFARIDKIYILNHGEENNLLGQGNIESITSIMSNCIQHHWNSSLIGKLTGAIMHMTESIKVQSLYFVPDESVVEFILNDR